MRAAIRPEIGHLGRDGLLIRWSEGRHVRHIGGLEAKRRRLLDLVRMPASTLNQRAEVARHSV